MKCSGFGLAHCSTKKALLVAYAYVCMLVHIVQRAIIIVAVTKTNAQATAAAEAASSLKM